MPIKICLDAGHYGKRNQSPVVPQYYESVQMWKLYLKLKKYLESFGIRVISTRAEQTKDLEVYQRGYKSKGCDMFISLHSNATGDKSSKTNRVDVYAPYDDLNDSHEFGLEVARAVASVMEIPESTVKTRKSEKGDFEYYGVMRGARSAGCPLYYLIEHSFHTNADSARWLLDDSNLDKLAFAEAKTIAEYFGIVKPKEVKTVNIELAQLTKGDKGAEVKTLQRLLIARGYTMPKYGADGSYGNETENAVKSFQKINGLTVDGIVGKATWSELLKG